MNIQSRIEPTFTKPDTMIFTLVKVDRTYSVHLDSGDGQPVTFLENCRHFSTIAQLVLEGLRRVATQNPALVLVVDDATDGEWEYWLSHSTLGHVLVKDKVPLHTILN